MTEFPYQYVVLRCVPRVDRDEFVNVAVVLHCQAADYLSCADHLDETRLHGFSPGLDLESLRSGLRAVGGVCAGTGPSAASSQGQRFGWLAAPKSTMLQPGPVHGGLAREPAAELLRLLDLLVR